MGSNQTKTEVQSKPTPLHQFTKEQMHLQQDYYKTFEKHQLPIDEYERQVYRFKKFRRYAGTPEEFKRESFDTMKEDPNQKDYIEQVKEFIESQYTFAILFSNPSGNGKTRLAHNLVRKFYYTYEVEPDRVWIFDQYYPSCYFMTSGEYMRLLQSYSGKFMSCFDLNRKLSELDFLVIDEMFSDLMLLEKEFTGYAYDLFDLTVSGLARNKNFKLVYTANKTADELDGLDNRMASRLRKRNVLLINMNEYKKDWRDWRLNG